MGRLDKEFGASLDRRVRAAMTEAHMTGAINAGDFGDEVKLAMASLAADPSLNSDAQRGMLAPTSASAGLHQIRPLAPRRRLLIMPPLQGGGKMIMEIAQIEVTPGMENAFEIGVKNAVPLFKRAKGCQGIALQHSHEKPQRYRLFVKWETLENHTVDFRGSHDFQEWRNLVGHTFASPPEVEHVTEVVSGF